MIKDFKMNNSFGLKLIFNVFIIIILSLQSALAQGGSEDFFRNIGKIYVVVAVVMATFIGIVLFLIYLSRKIRKLEEDLNH